jgi:hypothetical protein
MLRSRIGVVEEIVMTWKIKHHKGDKLLAMRRRMMINVVNSSIIHHARIPYVQDLESSTPLVVRDKDLSDGGTHLHCNWASRPPVLLAHLADPMHDRMPSDTLLFCT